MRSNQWPQTHFKIRYKQGPVSKFLKKKNGETNGALLSTFLLDTITDISLWFSDNTLLVIAFKTGTETCNFFKGVGDVSYLFWIYLSCVQMFLLLQSNFLVSSFLFFTPVHHGFCYFINFLMILLSLVHFVYMFTLFCT